MLDVRNRLFFQPHPCKYPHTSPVHCPEVGQDMSAPLGWLTDPTPPSTGWRIRASLVAAIVAGIFVILLYQRQKPGVISDWDPTFAATEALLRGENPYAAIQVPPWPNWLLYPLPALLFTAPFTLLPLELARLAVHRSAVWQRPPRVDRDGVLTTPTIIRNRFS